MSWLVLLGTTVAAVAVAWLVVRFVLLPRQIARYHDDVAGLMCVPAPPDADHEPHLPLVHEYEAAGYRIHSYIRVHLGGESKAVTLLEAADLSVADVAVRSDGPASSITSLLADGTLVLETNDRQTTPSAPGRLLQVFPGATVPALVRRHQEALAWLAGMGTVASPHPTGPPGVIETAAHVIGRTPPPSPAEVAALARDRVTTHLGPISRQPDIADQLRLAGLTGV